MIKNNFCLMVNFIMPTGPMVTCYTCGLLKLLLVIRKENCQAQVPGLTDWIVKHLREKLKYQREFQKRTKADAIIKINPPTHLPQKYCVLGSFDNSSLYSLCLAVISNKYIWMFKRFYSLVKPFLTCLTLFSFTNELKSEVRKMSELAIGTCLISVLFSPIWVWIT